MSVVTRIRTREESIVPFTVPEVWRVLADVTAYPGWWPPKLPVKVLLEAPGLLGTEIEVRPVLGGEFRCRFEEIDEPRELRLRFFNGSLEGPGGFHLEPRENCTRVICESDVFARGLDVAVFSRVFPLGTLHAFQMRSLLRGLERRLCKLRAAAVSAGEVRKAKPGGRWLRVRVMRTAQGIGRWLRESPGSIF